MLTTPRVVQFAARKIAQAVERTAASVSTGQIAEEPDFTSRMVSRIEDAVRDAPLEGSVSWSAHVLRSHGPGSAEKMYGADFLGALSIDTNGFVLQKGFLAQAKLQEPNDVPNSAEWRRLESQCQRMLELSSAAYVFYYSPSGVRIAPAISVLAAGRREPAAIYSRSVATFFRLHLECFVGDGKFKAANESELVAARSDADARVALLLQLRG